MKEVYIALINEKGEFLVEIQDGKVTIPKTIIEEEKFVSYKIQEYLNKSWGIDINIFLQQECYIVSRNNIESCVIVIKKDDWKKKDIFNSVSTYSMGPCEFQSLCDKKVVTGGWGNKECLIGLGAFYLQNIKEEVKSWAKAKLISIIVVPEKNLSTI
ncbi:MAG: hypothetical protein PHD31_01255 [Candidatus Pacebacteria bacterium]|nr:hypothetical protein [Candidatus Paceibacterota bacterium]